MAKNNMHVQKNVKNMLVVLYFYFSGALFGALFIVDLVSVTQHTRFNRNFASEDPEDAISEDIMSSSGQPVPNVPVPQPSSSGQKPGKNVANKHI